MARHKVTDEEKVANKISSLLTDLRLDLELVAIYISDLSPRLVVNRLALIAEIAKEEKDNERHTTY